MSAALTRQLRKRPRTCATPNRREDAPLCGWLIALVCALVFVFGIAIDAHKAIAAVWQ